LCGPYAFRRPLLLYPAGSKNTRLADDIVKLAARFRGGEKTRDGFPFFRKSETFLKIHARAHTLASRALRVRTHAAASDRNGIPLASVALAESYKSQEYTRADGYGGAVASFNKQTSVAAVASERVETGATRT